MDRVSLGIPLLDKLLSGGIPKGHQILLAGNSGAGKTILSLQYLLHGAQKGEKGIFICLDNSPDRMIQMAKSLSWPILDAIESNSLSFLDMSDFFTHSLSINSQQDIDRIIQNIMQLSHHADVQRICIDPFIPFTLLAESQSNICYYIRKMISAIQLMPQSTPLISCRFDQHPWIFQALQGLTDGCIQLSQIDQKRSLHISKMACTNIPSHELTYDIQPQKGIVLRLR